MEARKICPNAVMAPSVSVRQCIRRPHEPPGHKPRNQPWMPCLFLCGESFQEFYGRNIFCNLLKINSIGAGVCRRRSKCPNWGHTGGTDEEDETTYSDLAYQKDTVN